jgi:hypothetical protein
MKTKPREGKRDRPQTSQAQPSGKEEMVVGYSRRIALKRKQCNEYSRCFAIGESTNGRF